MGWMWEPRPPGKSLREILMQKATYESGPVRSRALDCAIVKLRTAYLAVEYEDTRKGTRKVYGLVFLLGYAPNDPFDFGHKDVDEDMGPCEDECPERILDLLTPTEHPHALNWRRRCRERIEASKAAPAIRTGAWLKLSRPLRFADGSSHDTFYVANARRRRFESPKGRSPFYRLPAKPELARIGYEVLDHDPAETPGLERVEPSTAAGPQTPPPEAQPSLLAFAGIG